MSTPQTVHRALLARDVAGVVRVLATDSADIAYDVGYMSTDAGEIGMVVEGDVGAGLYLWTGTIVMGWTRDGHGGCEPEPEYTGELRAVLGPTAAAPSRAGDLFLMAPPPEPESDDGDRDSAGV